MLAAASLCLQAGFTARGRIQPRFPAGTALLRGAGAAKASSRTRDQKEEKEVLLRTLH